MENMRIPESYLMDVIPDNVESILDVGVGIEGIFNFHEWERRWDEGSLKRKVCTDINIIKDDIPITWEKKICDGCFLPFNDNTFDVVISTDVIQYIELGEKRDKFISELERVSKDLIYIAVSDEGSDEELDLKFPEQEFFKLKGYHILFLDLTNVKCFKRKISSWGSKFYDMEDYVKTVGILAGLNGSIDNILDCGTGLKGVVAQDYYENIVRIKKGYACDVWTLKEMDRRWTGLKINALDLLDTGKGGIGEKSVDIVQAFGFLEHLTKNDGYQFLFNAEKIARKAIIISAAAFVHGLSCTEKAERDGNPYHAYRSVWHWDDFSRLGYKTNKEHVRQGLTFSEEAIAWKIL